MEKPRIATHAPVEDVKTHEYVPLLLLNAVLIVPRVVENMIGYDHQVI
jgi:hypothetical protein